MNVGSIAGIAPGRQIAGLTGVSRTMPAGLLPVREEMLIGG